MSPVSTNLAAHSTSLAALTVEACHSRSPSPARLSPRLSLPYCPAGLLHVTSPLRPHHHCPTVSMEAAGLDTSGFTLYVTSDNYTGDAIRKNPIQPSSASASAVDSYRQQLAEHTQSFTASFLASQPDVAAEDRQSILALSSSLHPPPPPPRRVRGYIDGCYDLLHSGHYNAIRQAKSLCDELVLGIHSDVEIAHHKGPTVMSDTERVAAVRACKWLDAVVFGVPYDPSVELLDYLGCDFCVHGDDLSVTATGEDAFAKVKKVGRMKVVKRTEGISTTDLVGRLLVMAKTKQQRRFDKQQLPPHQQPPQQQSQLQHASSTDNSASHPPSSRSVASQPLPLATQRMSSFLPMSFRISQFANNRTPSPSDCVVYISGSFDLFHVGHIAMLEAARRLGSFLYVGVYEDEEVERVSGVAAVMSLFERVLNVLACRCVDEVVLGVRRRVSADMMKSLNIAHVVDSEESERRMVQRTRHTAGDREEAMEAWSGVSTDEAGMAEAKAAGVYRVLELTCELTTADVVTRILDNQTKYENRNRKRTTQESDYHRNKEYVEERKNR